MGTSNGLPSLLDRLRNEIEASPDTSDFTATSWIRHRLLRGETLTREGVVEEFGVSRGLLDQTVKILHACGWDLEWLDVDGLRGTRITDPHPINVRAVEAFMREQSEKAAARTAEKAAAAAKAEAAREKATRDRAATVTRKNETSTAMAVVGGTRVANLVGASNRGARSNGDVPGYPVEAAPSIDDDLTVYLLARNLDGTMTIGLRNGTRAWVATLTGMTLVEQ